ncbi:MAG TPA: aminoglycoside phosphotransferase family protein [Candidatus Paceibacterota bacterium]|nr:aminoglycoside phosphotransferase family protein [Candidatus Paceibacterota bacterium]
MKFEKPLSKITFLNEPKLSEHEVDQKFNARRINLIPHVKDFISNHPKFKNKEVKVTFAEKGVSSLISIMEVSGEKTILKINLSLSHALGEAKFLKVWEEAGVKVPHVIEEGMISEHAYTLMEYVDAKILNDVYTKGEMIRKEIYIELGKILRVMHEPEAQGYGRIVDGKVQYAAFEEWLQGEDVQKQIRYVQENKLLGDEHGSISFALEVLKEHANKENKSSYCHDDFGAANIFATNPLTVFDPNPRFNNGYIDLGRSMIIAIANNGGKVEIGEQFIKGYFDGKPFNRRALQAAMMLNIYMKFPYQHKTKSFNRIKNLQEYLIRTKHLLMEEI